MNINFTNCIFKKIEGSEPSYIVVYNTVSHSTSTVAKSWVNTSATEDEDTATIYSWYADDETYKDGQNSSCLCIPVTGIDKVKISAVANVTSSLYGKVMFTSNDMVTTSGNLIDTSMIGKTINLVDLGSGIYIGNLSTTDDTIVDVPDGAKYICINIKKSDITSITVETGVLTPVE